MVLLEDISANYFFQLLFYVQAKFTSFFGPGITAEVGESENLNNYAYMPNCLY